MKFIYIGKDCGELKNNNIYEGTEFLHSGKKVSSFSECTNVMIDIKGKTYKSMCYKSELQVIYEDISKSTEIVNLKTNEFGYFLKLIKKTDSKYFIKVKINDSIKVWDYHECEILKDEIYNNNTVSDNSDTNLINNNNKNMSTLQKLINDKVFDSELTKKVIDKGIEINNRKKELEIKKEKILNKLDNINIEIEKEESLFMELDNGLENKDIELVNRILNK